MTTVASGSSCSRIVATASGASSGSPCFDTANGSTTIGRINAAENVGDRLDESAGCEHPGLDGVDADVGEHGVELRADRLDGKLPVAPCTPTEFCAVTAVTTLIPCTPSASIVFRSAWMPAPPPESEPATVSTRGGVTAFSLAHAKWSCPPEIGRPSRWTPLPG